MSTEYSDTREQGRRPRGGTRGSPHVLLTDPLGILGRDKPWFSGLDPPAPAAIPTNSCAGPTVLSRIHTVLVLVELGAESVLQNFRRETDSSVLLLQTCVQLDLVFATDTGCLACLVKRTETRETKASLQILCVCGCVVSGESRLIPATRANESSDHISPLEFLQGPARTLQAALRARVASQYESELPTPYSYEMLRDEPYTPSVRTIRSDMGSLVGSLSIICLLSNEKESPP